MRNKIKGFSAFICSSSQIWIKKNILVFYKQKCLRPVITTTKQHKTVSSRPAWFSPPPPQFSFQMLSSLYPSPPAPHPQYNISVLGCKTWHSFSSFHSDSTPELKAELRGKKTCCVFLHKALHCIFKVFALLHLLSILLKQFIRKQQYRQSLSLGLTDTPFSSPATLNVKYCTGTRKSYPCL